MHFQEHIHTRQNRPNHTGYVPEYLITWLKLLYVSANRFNPSRYVSSEYLVFWFQKPTAHRRTKNGLPLRRCQSYEFTDAA